MSLLSSFILLAIFALFVALILPQTLFGRSSFYLSILAVCGAAIAFCGGCSTTTVYEMDATGKTVVKKTVSEEPVTKTKVVGIFNTTTGVRIAVNGYSNDGSIGSIELGETGNGYVSAPQDTSPLLVEKFGVAITNLHKNTSVSFKGYSAQASGSTAEADTSAGTATTVNSSETAKAAANAATQTADVATEAKDANATATDPHESATSSEGN